MTAPATKPASLADAIRDLIAECDAGTLKGMVPRKVTRAVEPLRAALPRAEAADALAEAASRVIRHEALAWVSGALTTEATAAMNDLDAALRRYRGQS